MYPYKTPYQWYVSFLDILNALYICSTKNNLISWCGNVIFEKHIFSFAICLISSFSPNVPPITKVIELFVKETFSIFLEKDKLYPSRLASGRFRTDAEHNHRASDDINSYVIAVDSNGKIIYMALGTGHGKGSPCDPFYHRKDIIEAKNLDCFHLLDSYRPFRDGLNPLGYMDFEFIIPKEGFVITISNNAFEKRTLLSFLLKGNNLLNGGKIIWQKNKLK